MKKASLAIYLFNGLLYFSCIVFGIVLISIGKDASQSTLIVLEGLQALLLAFLPLFAEKIFKVKFSFLAYLLISVFTLLAVFFGEALQFFYKVSWWDTFLHLFSGALLTALGISLGNLFFPTNEKNTGLVLFGIFFALACGVLWEFAEFTIDSIFGTNMQKFMPESYPYFNGGNSFIPLNGSDAEIAEFFRYPSGYKFALKDTMEDIVCNISGVLLGLSAYLLMFDKRIVINNMLSKIPAPAKKTCSDAKNITSE